MKDNLYGWLAKAVGRGLEKTGVTRPALKDSVI